MNKAKLSSAEAEVLVKVPHSMIRLANKLIFLAFVTSFHHVVCFSPILLLAEGYESISMSEHPINVFNGEFSKN